MCGGQRTIRRGQFSASPVVSSRDWTEAMSLDGKSLCQLGHLTSPILFFEVELSDTFNFLSFWQIHAYIQCTVIIFTHCPSPSTPADPFSFLTHPLLLSCLYFFLINAYFSTPLLNTTPQRNPFTCTQWDKIPVFTEVLILRAETWRRPQFPSTGEWLNSILATWWDTVKQRKWINFSYMVDNTCEL